MLTGNNNLIWHLSSKYDCEVHILSLQKLAPENQFYKVEMKIFKENVFYQPVNLFTVKFLCVIETVRLP